MLMTVDHAVERMRQLMLQLREGPSRPAAFVASIARRHSAYPEDKHAQGRQIDVKFDERLVARGHDEATGARSRASGSECPGCLGPGR